VLRDPLGEQLKIVNRTSPFEPGASVRGLARGDGTLGARWRQALIPATVGMLLAFGATTVVLRTDGGGGGSSAARVAPPTTSPGTPDVSSIEATLQDELQLRFDDPDFPGQQLTITTVRCSPPVGGRAECAAGFVDQGGRAPLRVAVTFPAGRLTWRLVR
jgi:hypothetical protein